MSEDAIDYKTLLTRYIQHITEVEGGDFIRDTNPFDGVQLTDEEREILTNLAETITPNFNPQTQ